MKIVVAEKISSAALALLRGQPGWTVVTPEQFQGKLGDELSAADALIVRSAVQVDGALLKLAPRLRVVGRAGVGVDNIDLAAATKLGVVVMNTPGANAVAVAELTLGLMIAMARHLPRADRLLHAGQWEKKSLQGLELRGKTLGIVGLGRIGMEVARRARAFGMTVVAHDPFVSAGAARELGIALIALEELYSASDYVTLHVALTPQNAGMIHAAALAQMKQGARLVNCARGELVDEAALADALRSGHLAGAALDVFNVEPPTDSPLLALDNVVLTPHIAGSTHEAQDAVGVQIAEQVREYLLRGVILNAVNVPSVSADEYAQLAPYIALGEKLGALIVQLSDGAPQELSIRYSAMMKEWKTELLRNAVISGVLNHVMAEKANLVNAAQIAAERGLRLHESRSDKAPTGGAGNVLSVLLKTATEERMVRGAVLHGHAPRLLGLDDIDVEAPLDGHLVFLRNRDVPGVIGRIGTILGAHGINIANFSLGRREARSSAASAREAVAVVHVDTAVPAAVIAELKGIDAVLFARAITV